MREATAKATFAATLEDQEVLPGSFRDRGGRVYRVGGRILRSVRYGSAQAYEAARDAGLYERLLDRGMIVPLEEVDAPEPLPNEESAAARYWLEHPRLPFISHPYEWPFSLWKAAALHHLDVQLEALSLGFSLTDATAYNIQFDGVRPLHIDHLSFRPYREGELWVGHHQFCCQFLNPLILWAKKGIAPNAWFRGGLEGITPEELSALLPWHGGFSFTVLSHVKAQAAVHRRKTNSRLAEKPEARQRLSKTGLEAMLRQLKSFIGGLQQPRGKTMWSDYAGDNSYADEAARSKRDFIRDLVCASSPGLLFDFGCNSGDYSIAALEAGARRVVGFDYDFGALEKAVERAGRDSLPFTPLWLDAANPSPAQGWAQSEREGLGDRAKGDSMIALALIHHIVIGRNVPMDMTIDWLMQSAPEGVIEFPPKSDPMVRQLLSSREDIFEDYCEEAFRAAVNARGAIVGERRLGGAGRLLLHYRR
jgi:ribosomal protein L11 methylase PrmA